MAYLDQVALAIEGGHTQGPGRQVQPGERRVGELVHRVASLHDQEQTGPLEKG